MILNDRTLVDGVSLIRDRETCCFEEVHVAAVTRRLVHIFRHRDTEDTFTRMKQKQSKPGKCIASTRRKKEEEKRKKKKSKESDDDAAISKLCE